MPIWSDFLESLTGVAKAVGGAFAEIPKGVVSTLLQFRFLGSHYTWQRTRPCC
jgi:hypothetical protein